MYTSLGFQRSEEKPIGLLRQMENPGCHGREGDHSRLDQVGGAVWPVRDHDLQTGGWLAEGKRPLSSGHSLFNPPR